jgi:hypothetical protein
MIFKQFTVQSASTCTDLCKYQAEGQDLIMIDDLKLWSQFTLQALSLELEPEQLALDFNSLLRNHLEPIKIRIRHSCLAKDGSGA